MATEKKKNATPKLVKTRVPKRGSKHLRTIKGWTIEPSQELDTEYGVDLEAEITEILKAEAAQQLPLTNKWHKKFLKFAKVIADENSKDKSTKVGCIIVDHRKNPRSFGWNGFPRKIKDDHRYDNRDIKYKIVIHAELNAILNCAEVGVSTRGCSCYVTHPPCAQCAGAIIQAGISHVIVNKPSADLLSRWKADIDLAKQLLEEAGVKVTEL